MLASSVVLGLVAGLAIRRSWRPLLEADLRWLPLLIGSLLIRSIAVFLGDAGYVVYVAALAGTTLAAAANHRIFGALLIAIGGSLNLTVVLLNHGMPVDPAALAAANVQMPRDALHVVFDASTRFPVLADVIPFGLARSVYSAGDVSIALGGFLVPFAILARR